MKFHKAPPTEDLFLRVVDETNTIQVGIYPVLFGYRVRAGRVDDKWGVNLDWCCGADFEFILWLYRACITLLSSREPDTCFDGLPPISQIKPAFNDKDFMVQIITLLKDMHLMFEYEFTRDELFLDKVCESSPK